MKGDHKIPLKIIAFRTKRIYFNSLVLKQVFRNVKTTYERTSYPHIYTIVSLFSRIVISPKYSVKSSQNNVVCTHGVGTREWRTAGHVTSAYKLQIRPIS